MFDGSTPPLELWYAALADPIGIKVQTNDALRLKAKLYVVRRESGDPDLAKLMIQTSPTNPTGELIITHREVELPEGLNDVEG